MNIDGSGSINFEELKLALNKLGKRYSNEKILKMIKSVDSDGDGDISFEEFCKLLTNWKQIASFIYLFINKEPKKEYYDL